jgi:histidyl-tRNA synthetase
MFRRERPQKGRFRQFYQINAEVFGIASPLIDAQMIFMLMLFFNRLSVPDISVHINSLGCMKCRPDYKSALSVFLENKKDFLCEDCKKRSDKNPLRVLDCKVPDCREVLKDAPDIANYLCKDCKDHFETVILWLNGLNVPYAIDKRLVRGLDYYTRTTFEIQTGSLGAQSAVAGGGRYDCLVKSLGGPDQPAIGFAIGFDRLVSIFLIDNKKDFTRRPGLFIAALGEKGRAMAFDWLCTFFKNGICAEMDYEDRSLKSQMNRANKLGARYVLILGENEISTGSCILRNMNTKEQKEILLSEVVQEVGRLKAED